MSLFERLGGQPQQQPQQRISYVDEMKKLQAGPVEYLQSHGLNIPAGMTDPREITQHLMRSGQVGAPRFRQIIQLLGGKQ